MSEANTVIPLREHQEPATQEPRRFKVFTARQLDKIEQLQRLDDDARSPCAWWPTCCRSASTNT
jgi:hypothetical protein